MSRAVLLPSAKQRYATAATHPWLKPLLLGAVLGALVVQALHAVTGGRSASSAEPSLRESVYALGNVWPNSHTTRNEDGLVCEACERAIAQKEVELARLRDRVRDVSKENLKMLEEIDFAREGGSGRDGGGDGERDGGGEREGDGDGDGDGEDGATTSTTSAISRTGKHNGKERKQITVFVGIQTGYSPDAPPGGNYNYEDRRKAIRETWFRSGDAVYMKKLEEAGIVAKFVIGSGKTAPVKEAFASEQQQHDDFLVLPIVEDYHNLVNKTREFIRAVMESYEPKYIVKVDDDVYLKLTRLPEAVKQWESRQVDYTGCMKRGPVYHDPSNRWYEPQHALLGSEYFSHCWGSLYVMSGKAATSMLAVPEPVMRSFDNEDVTIGAFMLAANVQHYDDRRLCADTCENGGIGLYDVPTPGLNPVIARMHELHESAACRADEDRFDVSVPAVMPAIVFSTVNREG